MTRRPELLTNQPARPVRIGDHIRYRGWNKMEWPTGHEVTAISKKGFSRILQKGSIDVEREDVASWKHADGAPIDVETTFAPYDGVTVNVQPQSLRVWVVEVVEVHDSNVVGVFASQELADQYMAAHSLPDGIPFYATKAYDVQRASHVRPESVEAVVTILRMIGLRIADLQKEHDEAFLNCSLEGVASTGASIGSLNWVVDQIKKIWPETLEQKS